MAIETIRDPDPDPDPDTNTDRDIDHDHDRDHDPDPDPDTDHDTDHDHDRDRDRRSYVLVFFLREFRILVFNTQVYPRKATSQVITCFFQKRTFTPEKN